MVVMRVRSLLSDVALLSQRTSLHPSVHCEADVDDHKAMIELALIENLQRADLHPLVEARAFGVMREELSYSYRQIALRVSRCTPTA
jgi:ParB family transcriptional regulator, chromosome partitioning protein